MLYFNFIFFLAFLIAIWVVFEYISFTNGYYYWDYNWQGPKSMELIKKYYHQDYMFLSRNYHWFGYYFTLYWSIALFVFYCIIPLLLRLFRVQEQKTISIAFDIINVLILICLATVLKNVYGIFSKGGLIIPVYLISSVLFLFLAVFRIFQYRALSRK